MRVPRFLFALPLLISIQVSGHQRASKPIRTGQGQNTIAALSRKALPTVMIVVTFDRSGKELGQGSGFFVSSDGKLVTNYHVVENASSALIKSGNGAFYAVEGVVALDRESDLAVLKASGGEFPALPLGNSESVRVGESVIAIGSPLALEGTVSNGIVSGLRELGEGQLKVIQTTAPISPGSSRGPLLNMKGEVIGVTAYHLVQGENLNFAIAANSIKPLLVSKMVTAFAPERSSPAVGEEETPQASSEGEGKEVYETCHCANFAGGLYLFRSSSSDDDIGRVQCGEELKVIGEERGRLQVKSSTGLVGYVSAAFVCKTNIPTDLPKEWIDLGQGAAVTVRQDGDYLYEMGTFSLPPGNFVKEGSFICDTKRTGSKWAGRCRLTIQMRWTARSTEYTCLLELDQRLTSVTLRRIEGELQDMEPVSSLQPPACPQPKDGWLKFAMIPKN